MLTLRRAIVTGLGLVFVVISIESLRVGRLNQVEASVFLLSAVTVVFLGLTLKPMKEDEEDDDG